MRELKACCRTDRTVLDVLIYLGIDVGFRVISCLHLSKPLFPIVERLEVRNRDGQCIDRSFKRTAYIMMMCVRAEALLIMRRVRKTRSHKADLCWIRYLWPSR